MKDYWNVAMAWCAAALTPAAEQGLANCFLQLSSIDVRLRHASSHSRPQLPRNVPVTFREPNVLYSHDDNSIEFEIQSATHSRILSELDTLEDVTLQTYCYSRLELPFQNSTQALKRRRGQESRVWRLNVIIYGILDLRDTIGQCLSKRRLYLQDPIDCERNVLYRNPHMISKGGDIVMTESFRTPPTEIEIERLSVGPDLLAQLMAEQIPLPESEPPTTVTTRLFRFVPSPSFKLYH
jgi:SWI/SNF-related matrix-associated actin-dependent regulator of chromatin subfamily A3